MPDATEKRIIDLDEITTITSDMYVMVDNVTPGTRKYNFKTLTDNVESAASAANIAAGSARTAASVASDAAQTAASAVAAVETTTSDMESRVAQALASVDDVVAQAIPLMTPDVRGGAILGHGLEVTDGVLSVSTEGDGAIRSVTAEGWAEQDSTTGKNLLPILAQTRNGMAWAIVDGALSFSGTAEATYAYYYPQNVSGNSNKLALQAGTYTISGAIQSTNGISIEVQVTKDGTALLPWGNPSGTFTLDTASDVLIYFTIRSLTAGVSYAGNAYLQLELGSTATEYEPYTGGAPSPSPNYPQEIQVARGRNLLDESNAQWVEGSYINNSGDVSASSGENYMYSQAYTPVVAGESYALSYRKTSSVNVGGRVAFYDSSKTFISIVTVVSASTATGVVSGVAQAPSNAAYARLSLVRFAEDVQLELGTTATPYVPYGHVGLEVTHGSTTTTIPIPLPSKGYAASLPDGTCDTLTIDGAGCVEWESAVGRIESYAGESVSQPYLSTTGELSTGAEVYHKASPTTEDCYVDLPITVDGDTVDIPELEDVAVVRWADTVATEVARQWYRRAQAVEARVAALEQAVAEIVANG